MEEFYANYDETEVEEIVTEVEEITSEVEAIETEVEDIESEAEVTVDDMIEDEENIPSDQTDQ
jgi:N utilization substance protein A